MPGLTKEKIYAYCDAVIEYAFYLLLFALPFAKAVVESMATFMIVAWFCKRLLVLLAAKGSLWQRLYLCRPVSTYLNVPLAVYFFTLAVSVAFSSNFALSAKTFFSKTLEYVLLFFIVSELVNNRQRLARTLLVILVSATMVAVDCIVQQLYGFDLLRHYPLEAERSTGSFQMPGVLGGYIGMVLCIVLALAFLRLRKKVNLALVVLAFLLLAVLVATFSRGAWLGFAVGLVFLGFFENKKILFYALAVLAVLALLLPLVIDTPYSIAERLKSFSFFASSADLDRKAIWEISLRMIKDKPVFGHGLSNFMGTFVRYGEKLEAYKIQGIVPYAHNCYLQIAAETGVLGLASFLLLIGTFLIRSVNFLRRSKKGLRHAALAAVSAGICASLAHSAVDTNLYSLQLAVLLWCMLGVNAALEREVDFE